MDITILLKRAYEGDRDAFNEAMPLVYDELKRLAESHVRREGKYSSTNATTLVHEAYLRLVDARHPHYSNRAHFYSIASRVMRQVLVDKARMRLARKRGGEEPLQLADLSEFGVQADETLLALDAALDRLAGASPEQARLIELRYFGGLTAEDCAAATGRSVHMVRKDLRLAQAWLRRELAAGTGTGD